jgi:hypothetical protein
MRQEITDRTLLSSDRLRVIHHCAELVNRRKIPGATAELGVFRGGVSKLIATMLPDRAHYCFDTFTGIPNAAPDIDGHTNGDFSTNFDEVQAFLNDANIVFCAGVFPQTTQNLQDITYALVHIDADTYQSTVDALNYFYPRLAPGGFMLFDDYEWQHCHGVKKALLEFLADKPETVDPVARYQGVIVKHKKCGTLLLAHDGQTDINGFATKLGDTVCAIISARAWVKQYAPEQILLTLCRDNQWNKLWDKFIDDYRVTTILHEPDQNSSAKYSRFDKWRQDQAINGIQFDVYRELYARLDGGSRQNALCLYERGLGRQHVFEYYHWGQEIPVLPAAPWAVTDDVIYVPPVKREEQVLIAPVAFSQGNSVFNEKFWRGVYAELTNCGIRAVWNTDVATENLAEHVAKNALVCCGNTGIGWMAAVTGTPFIACEPFDSQIYDYRYELFKPSALIDIIDTPDVLRMVAAVRSSLHFLTPAANPALITLRNRENGTP